MLHAEDLTKAWADGTLEHNTIRNYLTLNLDALKYMSVSELDHVADLCYGLYEWSTKERPCGGFLTAVIKNDLDRAVHAADDTNMKQLWIYPAFIYNCAPQGWKDQKNEKASQEARQAL